MQWVKLGLWGQASVGLHRSLELEASYFASMNLSFLTCQMGIMMVMAVPGVCGEGQIGARRQSPGTLISMLSVWQWLSA